jgi:hypothetical protein
MKQLYDSFVMKIIKTILTFTAIGFISLSINVVLTLIALGIAASCMIEIDSWMALAIVALTSIGLVLIIGFSCIATSIAIVLQKNAYKTALQCCFIGIIIMAVLIYMLCERDIADTFGLGLISEISAITSIILFRKHLKDF